MIRFATEDDAPEICRIYGPAVTEGASAEIVVPTEAEMRQRMRTVMLQYPWLVDDRGGSLRGFSYATSHRPRAAYQWSVEVSVYVDADSRREGRARALYLRLFEILRQLQLHSAYAVITMANKPSQWLHESLGFAQIGVFPHAGFKSGRWLDVGWWYLPLHGESDQPPRPPIPWSQWRAAQDDIS
jgi:phosphinothricin acetyltransferase